MSRRFLARLQLQFSTCCIEQVVSVLVLRHAVLAEPVEEATADISRHEEDEDQGR